MIKFTTPNKEAYHWNKDDGKGGPSCGFKGKVLDNGTILWGGWSYCPHCGDKLPKMYCEDDDTND